jgi:hypothetical protein
MRTEHEYFVQVDRRRFPVAAGGIRPRVPPRRRRDDSSAVSWPMAQLPLSMIAPPIIYCVGLGALV